MTKHLAQFCSFIFHPIFIPLYAVLIVIFMFPYRYQHIPDKAWNLTIMILLAMTMFIPAVIVLIFKKLNMVDDYDISDRKQRILPYLIFFFFYMMTFMTIKPKTNSSLVFMEDTLFASIILGATISLGLAFFLNNFLKVSAHTNGVANLFTIICFLSVSTQKLTLVLILIGILVIGLTGSSRIFLKAHTTCEVYYGIFCGFLGQIIAFVFYLNSTI